MHSSILWQAPLSALAAAAKDPDQIPNVVVVMTGLSLVFLILFLLIAIILIQGKIFSSIERKKQEKEQENNAAPAPTAVLPPAPAVAMAVPAPMETAAPVIEAGIPQEVVAAIVAAVTAASGGAYTLQSVKMAKQGRGQWGLAGVLQSTEPF